MRAGLDAELDEGPRVDQQVDPLTGGQLAAFVLLGDLLFAAPELGRLATGVEVLDQRLHARLLAGLDLVRRLGSLRLLGGVDDLLRLVLRGHQRPFQLGSRFSKNAVTPSIASSVPSSIVS